MLARISHQLRIVWVVILKYSQGYFQGLGAQQYINRHLLNLLFPSPSWLAVLWDLQTYYCFLPWGLGGGRGRRGDRRRERENMNVG